MPRLPGMSLVSNCSILPVVRPMMLNVRQLAAAQKRPEIRLNRTPGPMKRLTLAFVALSALFASTGCCCLNRHCHSPWGCKSGCDGGCDTGGGQGAGDGGCSECGTARGNGGDYDAYAARHPGQAHPLVRRQRDAGGEYEFDSGPPTGQVAYPYYTTRGPRDFLAKNPRSIGP